MDNQTNKNSIIVTKEAVQKGSGIVILPLREYKKLCERAIPTYYLKGKEAKELDKLVKEGIRDYRAGKCKTLQSLADLD